MCGRGRRGRNDLKNQFDSKAVDCCLLQCLFVNLLNLIGALIVVAAVAAAAGRAD